MLIIAFVKKAALSERDANRGEVIVAYLPMIGVVKEAPLDRTAFEAQAIGAALPVQRHRGRISSGYYARQYPNAVQHIFVEGETTRRFLISAVGQLGAQRQYAFGSQA